jgi:NADH:ubiquinone oxidoreductase subunit 5 (subunit L)/multisubunit Na+/H+ antiporter MnhA subunit
MSGALFGMSILSVISILSLVLIGGLCVYCFTKAFGLSFLGSRREPNPPPVHEVPSSMLLPSFILIVFMLSIGIAPVFYSNHVIEVIQNTLNNSYNLITLPSTLHSISLVNIILILVFVGVVAIRAWQQSKVQISAGPTWGCGYTAGDYKHQYTPTSYADSLQEIVNPLIDFKKEYKSFDEKEIFPPPKTFNTENKDLVEEKTILSWVHLIVNNLPKAGIAQSGVINHYLLYPMLFLILIGFLIIINVL